MRWELADTISGIAVLVSATSALLSAGVAFAVVRMQHRVAAINRRRDAHLKYWVVANRALRELQAWHVALELPTDVDWVGVPVGVDSALDELRAVRVELEIRSPPIAEQCSRVLAATDLARADLQVLAGIRHEKRHGQTFGGLRDARDAVRSNLEAARTTLNEAVPGMQHYEARGVFPR